MSTDLLCYEGFLEILEPHMVTVGDQQGRFHVAPVCISPSASATSACRQGFALRAEDCDTFPEKLETVPMVCCLWEIKDLIFLR